MNTTQAKIPKGVKFDADTLVEFFRLDIENQEGISASLYNLKEFFGNLLEIGKIKRLRTSEKLKKYSFNYRYLTIVFSFDDLNNLLVHGIVNRSWIPEKVTDAVV